MKSDATFLVQGQSREPSKFPVPKLVLNSAVLLDSIESGLEMFSGSTENNVYQRYSNETVHFLEKKYAVLEGARWSLAVNSGMTACYLVTRCFLNAGDNVVSIHSMYHEITDQFFVDVKNCGISVTILEDYTIESFKAAITKDTQLVFVETPTNPTLFGIDLAALARLCKERKVLLVVDNSLLTPLLQKPLDLGADISLCSTTKMINGHGDALGGLISTNDPGLYEKMKAFRDNVGLILDPFSAWLTLRGMRTLSLRSDFHHKNSLAVLDFVRQKYPKLKANVPVESMFAEENGILGNAGILTLDFGDKASGTAFLRALKLFRIGTTFGNLESLVYHFGTFARPTRDISKIGVPLGLVRLSVGLEDIEDILEDLDQAIAQVQLQSSTATS